MKSSGIVDLPLHGGDCPRWLFPLMKKLAGNISELIVDEHGSEELLRRLSDPYWFQAFGCVLGFDWHSSGLTTTTTGALKQALKEKNLGEGLGIGFAGGKGKASRKTPEQILENGNNLGINDKKIKEFVRASRLSAKVDNSLLQDGFNLYHHTFFFTKNKWTVIQQGREFSRRENNNLKSTSGSSRLNCKNARRYHWISNENLNFIKEPHNAVVSDMITKPLNLIASECSETQKCSVDLIRENPIHLKKYFKTKKIKIPFQKTLFDFNCSHLEFSREHFPEIDADLKTLMKAYEQQPSDYEELILINGMGQKNIRALALISHLVYGTELSWKDPVKYSFAHGGKDGWPYPVDREKYNENLNFLKDTIENLRAGSKERSFALKRLNRFYCRYII